MNRSSERDISNQNVGGADDPNDAPPLRHGECAYLVIDQKSGCFLQRSFRLHCYYQPCHFLFDGYFTLIAAETKQVSITQNPDHSTFLYHWERSKMSRNHCLLCCREHIRGCDADGPRSHAVRYRHGAFLFGCSLLHAAFFRRPLVLEVGLSRTMNSLSSSRIFSTMPPYSS